MFSLDLQLRIDIDDLKIRKNLADRLSAARLFLEHFFELQIINEISLFDQRQQRMREDVRHSHRRLAGAEAGVPAG